MLRDMDLEIAQQYHHVDVWVSTDDYMPLIEIDTRLVRPGFPLRFIELNTMLPDGMWLHRKYDKLMYNSIVHMGENFNYILSSTLYPAEEPEYDQENMEELTEQAKQLESVLNKPEEKKKKKNMALPFGAASSKKIMMAKTDGADRAAMKKTVGKTVDKKGAKKAKPAEPAS